jgi:hypothetical protein
MRALGFFATATLTLIFLMVCAVLTAIIAVSVLNHVAPPFPQWIVWLAAMGAAGFLTFTVSLAKNDWHDQ